LLQRLAQQSSPIAGIKTLAKMTLMLQTVFKMSLIIFIGLPHAIMIA